MYCFTTVFSGKVLSGCGGRLMQPAFKNPNDYYEENEMVDTTGTIILWCIPVLAFVMIMLEDKRVMAERKAKAAK
jgi:hypothetical protein